MTSLSFHQTEFSSNIFDIRKMSFTNYYLNGLLFKPDFVILINSSAIQGFKQILVTK
jgi:hypothetical protein